MFSEDVKITQCLTVTSGAAGTTTLTGTTLDMLGYEGVVFIVAVGTIVTGGLQSFKVQEDSAAGMGTAADLEGSKQTIADSSDDTLLYTDLLRPTKRYVRLVITRATQNSTYGAVLALQYRAKFLPVTHGAGVTGEAHVSPDEGTA